MYRTGLGATLKQAQKQLRIESERLAQQRRITEAEMVAKDAAADTAELQGKVLTWAPRIIGGVALLVAAYLFLRKKKG